MQDWQFAVRAYAKKNAIYISARDWLLSEFTLDATTIASYDDADYAITIARLLADASAKRFSDDPDSPLADYYSRKAAACLTLAQIIEETKEQ